MSHELRRSRIPNCRRITGNPDRTVHCSRRIWTPLRANAHGRPRIGKAGSADCRSCGPRPLFGAPAVGRSHSRSRIPGPSNPLMGQATALLLFLRAYARIFIEINKDATPTRPVKVIV